MTKSKEDLNRYLITPSLLNAWGWIWECESSVKDSETDSKSFEDKVFEAQEKAKEDFIKTLKREPSEPNEYMLAGIQFEEECYKGNTCVSPIIVGGAFQIVGTKEVDVNGIKFLMYGRLDVLKGGIIYDIKRVWKYSPQKYLNSYQHPFYMELFPNAKEFEYLAFDGNKLHIEKYYPDQCDSISKVVIPKFIEWLKENDLWELYKEKWISK